MIIVNMRSHKKWAMNFYLSLFQTYTKMVYYNSLYVKSIQSGFSISVISTSFTEENFLEITNEYDDRLCVREYSKIKVSKLR